MAGPESAEFLQGKLPVSPPLNSLTDRNASQQGLVTNDIRHITPDSAVPSDEDEVVSPPASSPSPGVPRLSVYSMLLNHSGRIVFDAIVFRGRNAGDEFYLECDAEQASKLVRHLKLYRVRKKVDIEAMEQTRTAVVFNSLAEDDRDTPTAQLEEPGSVFCDQKEGIVPGCDLEIASDGILHTSDPRVPALGHRILAAEDQMPSVCASVGATQCDDPAAFERLRHRLGVFEGPSEMPAGKCLPLEYNADYMHGVSFHKGCYVGQELTARTHHTGVVRKRIMPLRLLDDRSASDVNLESDVRNEEGKKIGRIRAWRGRSGLGLMRVSESLDAESVLLGETCIVVSKPFWWPKEAPKKPAKKKDED